MKLSWETSDLNIGTKFRFPRSRSEGEWMIGSQEGTGVGMFVLIDLGKGKCTMPASADATVERLNKFNAIPAWLDEDTKIRVEAPNGKD